MAISISYQLYNELAEWYPLLTLLTDYQEEADYFHGVLQNHHVASGASLLELGSGAGYNAHYLKEWYRPVLTDLSNKMLELSKQINPELEHIQGDMRELRLERQFDVVFIHDAIMYMKNEQDLRKAITTAYVHCKPGGVVFITPDCVSETFEPSTDTGGEDIGGRSMRYLEWITGPNPDGTYWADFIVAMREPNGELRTFSERHEWGLFSEKDWLRFLSEAGFKPTSMRDSFKRVNFLGYKPV